MKYIRTRSNIYKSEDIDLLTVYFEENKTNNVSYNEIMKWKETYIKKEADTIEELCDRCVVVYQYSQEPFVKTFYEAKEDIEQWKRKIRSNNPVVAIYGAIWTEWGLKYVAKTKGVLPNGEIDWELL